MCFAHYENHCCRYCLLPLFSTPYATRYEPCFSAVCTGGGKIGNCVQQGVESRVAQRYDGCCVDCNPGAHNNLNKVVMAGLSRRMLEPPPAGVGEAMRSGFWGGDEEVEGAMTTTTTSVEMTRRRRERRAKLARMMEETWDKIKRDERKKLKGKGGVCVLF